MAEPLILQSHEDRLQRVEAGVEHSNVQLASLSVSVDGMTRSFEATMGRLEAKVDALKQVPARLAVLEDERKKKAKNIRIIRKAGLAAVIGMVGALATKLGAVLWSLIHK